jgi:hypothetical protein
MEYCVSSYLVSECSSLARSYVRLYMNATLKIVNLVHVVYLIVPYIYKKKHYFPLNI